MEAYQEKYIQNVRTIAACCDFFAHADESFESWTAARRAADETAAALRAENNALLNEYFFPMLDHLHEASDEDIRSLEAFSDVLMDWTTNLDCGLYALIHDALLSLYRIRGDRNGVIRELYKMGMGLFYLRRVLEGIDHPATVPVRFQNEMVFTEAGSYLKYFEQIDSEETKGYIIRSLANIAICSNDRRRCVSISSRILKIVQDPYYRNLAPGLPWDVFLRRTHQQMSANRDVLSKGGLSPEELAAIFDSCHVVFTPESDTDTPNVRWLWPYYEMEYTCGFVDLNTTLDRMEKLIRETSYEQYDVSGLYGAVQLPAYYGRLLRNNPDVPHRAKRLAFLREAYDKMMSALLTCPTEKHNDFFHYLLILVISDYYETEGTESYRSITQKLMKRVAGPLYLHSLLVGKILQLLAETVTEQTPGFFDDIPFLRAITDAGEKKTALQDYALLCGLYHDFGLIKMNMDRIRQTRNLLESEHQMYVLHTESGYADLKERPSTADFADIARGHHRWYNGTGGYPAEYVRTASPYRQMTDAVAIADHLSRISVEAAADVSTPLFSDSRREFSPVLTAVCEEPAFRAGLLALLSDPQTLYRSAYDAIQGQIRSDSV